MPELVRWEDIAGIRAEIVLTVGWLVLIILDAIRGKIWRAGVLVYAAVLSTAVFQCMYVRGVFFGGMLGVSAISEWLKCIGILLSLLVWLMLYKDELYKQANRESLLLMPGMLLGMMILTNAQHWLLIYMGFELLSLTGYALVGYLRNTALSAESAVRYLIFGVVSSALFLYGISLLYVQTGNLWLEQVIIGKDIVVGLLIWAGLAFKLAAFPFHFWVPDVYAGAPIGVAVLLSTVPKIGAAAVVMRLTESAGVENVWSYLLMVSALVSIIIGNIAAIRQDNYKQLLAWSGVSHIGIMMAGLVVNRPEAMGAVIFYLLVYGLATTGVFWGLSEIAKAAESDQISDWRGMGYRFPALTGVIAIQLVALVGLPPTAGFVAKVYVFTALIERWQTATYEKAMILALLLAAILSTVLSLYYYLGLLSILLKEKAAATGTVLAIPPVRWICIVIAGLALIWLGLFQYDGILSNWESGIWINK
jgi:NADH-quinone oxidoreductase subunit N